jgi:hypothetical protein
MLHLVDDLNKWRRIKNAQNVNGNEKGFCHGFAEGLA